MVAAESVQKLQKIGNHGVGLKQGPTLSDLLPPARLYLEKAP